MSVSIDILPFSTSLELDGEPDPSSAYSLSGHVAVTLSSSSSRFDRRRTIRFILQSLVITFEGQAELVNRETGYRAYRVCSVTKELAPDDAMEFNNEGHEDSDEPCVWTIVFNLPIPGWLPPSSVYGDCESGPVGTRYSLHATAKFGAPEDPSCISSFATIFWAAVCTSNGPSSKIVRAPKRDITIDRIITLPPSPSTPYKTFCVQVYDPETNAIPTNVLSKIRVAASVPEYIDMDGDSFELRLRIRAQELDAVHCRRLRMTDFSVDLHQQETYRARPSSQYSSRYPIPPRSSQPPLQPLLAPHPLGRLQALGIVPDNPNAAANRSFSVLPENSSGLYELSGDGYIFLPDGKDNSDMSACTWYAMEPSIPFVRQVGCKDADGKPMKEWAGERVLRASGTSPLFVTQHQLLLSMICTYDVDGDRDRSVTAKLEFSLPIQFARLKKYGARRAVRPALPVSPVDSISSSGCSSTPTTLESVDLTVPTACYHTNTLPAYSQLFDSNGDRKIDYSLPSYTPPSTSPDSHGEDL